MKVERSMYDALNTKALVGKTLSDRERKALRLLASKFRDNALNEADVPDDDWRAAVGDGVAVRAALEAKAKAKKAKGLAPTREALRGVTSQPHTSEELVARVTPTVEELTVVVEAGAAKGSVVSVEQWLAAKSELSDLQYGLGRSQLASAQRLVGRINAVMRELKHSSAEESDGPTLEPAVRKELVRRIRESRRAR